MSNSQQYKQSTKLGDDICSEAHRCALSITDHAARALVLSVIEVACQSAHLEGELTEDESFREAQVEAAARYKDLRNYQRDRNR